MKNIIDWHRRKYPKLNNQDIYKLVFQNEFAGGHMIDNPQHTLEYLEQEVSNLDDRYQDLYDDIGNNYVRINLRPYVKYSQSIAYLNDAFVNTANQNKGSKSSFQTKIDLLKIDEFDNLHHSDEYRLNYLPNYRLIDRKYLTNELKYLQIHNFISNLQTPTIISLEGKCGSGKTTIASRIKDNLDVTLINIDDFFLPQSRKTKARMQEIGGNIDYEGVHKLLTSIKGKQNITYFRYNCSSELYEKVTIDVRNIIILEGVYSYHPYFRSCIDKLIYLDIDEETQISRLKTRSNFHRFVKEWIPLENVYFESERIKYLADLIV
jgi:dephospho-CoA kinase